MPEIKSSLNKPLCKLKEKDVLKNNFSEFTELVRNPLYICKKCGRAAKRKRNLCKAEKI